MKRLIIRKPKEVKEMIGGMIKDTGGWGIAIVIMGIAVIVHISLLLITGVR